jgi:hypothetical protein
MDRQDVQDFFILSIHVNGLQQIISVQCVVTFGVYLLPNM